MMDVADALLKAAGDAQVVNNIHKDKPHLEAVNNTTKASKFLCH